MAAPASELPRAYSEVLLPSFGGYATETKTLEGVTFWPRVAARAIDTVAHYFIGRGAGFLFGTMLVAASGGHIPRIILMRLRDTGVTMFAFALLGFFAYYVIFTVVHGSTIGKRILSMVVVQEDGAPCGLKSAIVRELGYFVDALFFGLIGYTAMHDTVEQQRHGDSWAHTIVSKRSRIRPENLRGAGRFVVAMMFAFMADAACLMIGLLLVIWG